MANFIYSTPAATQNDANILLASWVETKVECYLNPFKSERRKLSFC